MVLHSVSDVCIFLQHLPASIARFSYGPPMVRSARMFQL